MKQYKWTTHLVKQETRDAITIVFNTGNEKPGYLPGQYLNITCLIDGDYVSRSYSFCSAPGDPFPAITVKRVPGGRMSNYLCDHAIHITQWDITAPLGNFTLNSSIAGDGEIVFLGGGSGISPLFSMLRGLDFENNKPLLLYSNKLPEETIYFEILEAMEAAGKLRVFYAFSAGAPSTKLNHIAGRFSPMMVKSVLRTQVKNISTAHYFLCGPAPLMDFHLKNLLSMSVAEAQIHIEHFAPVLVKPAIKTDDGIKEVLVSYYQPAYGAESTTAHLCSCLLEVSPGMSLLDTLKENGINVRSNCLNGTCGVCRATKEAGIVQMPVSYALTDKEIREGEVLLCQCYPVDDHVSILLS